MMHSLLLPLHAHTHILSLPLSLSPSFSLSLFLHLSLSPSPLLIFQVCMHPSKHCVWMLHSFIQSVPCAGTVESIITSLFSSLRSTLHSQLGTAMNSLAVATPPSSTLSHLPSLWSSHLATQVVLLATRLGLDAALSAAVQETEERGDRASLQGICDGINELVTVAVRMLQGTRLPVTEGESNMSTIAETPTPSVNDSRQQSRSLPVTSEQANRLESILLVLHSHLQAAVEMMTQHNEAVGGNSFSWRSRLHWTWSDTNKLREESCLVATLGASLPYGYHYVGSGGRVVLTPSTEKALVFLLQAVHHGHDTILNGPEVHVYTCTCTCTACVHVYQLLCSFLA